MRVCMFNRNTNRWLISGIRQHVFHFLHLQAANIPPPNMAAPHIRASATEQAWLSAFEVPDTFSTRTMEAISSGIITNCNRIEIIQTLYTLILVHTQRPSATQLFVRSWLRSIPNTS